MLKYLMLPVQASTHAASLDEMTALVHWLMLVLFVGWGAFFVFVLVRFRKKANPRADYAGAKGKFAKSTEIAVAVIEVVLLVGYAIPAWAVRVKTLPSESEAVVVRVVAEQFAWNIHYPGPDGKFGRTDVKLVNADNPLGLDRTDPNAKDDITTINQLNLPIDRPVLVLWGTNDPFLEPPTMEEWERFGSDVTLRIMDGGHWIYRDKADEVNTLVDEFLKLKGDLR